MHAIESDAARSLTQACPYPAPLKRGAGRNVQPLRQNVADSYCPIRYLLKQAAFTDVVRGIREVKEGNKPFSPAITTRLTNLYLETVVRGTPIRKRTDVLTPREAEVLQLIAEGAGNKQIAAELEISVKTVERHRQRLMNKLDIHDVAGLTRYAVSKGIIERRAPAGNRAVRSART